MSRLRTPGLRRAQIRTTATAMLGVVVILLAAGVGLVRLFEREQLRELDDRLESASRSAGEYIARAEAQGITLQGEPGTDSFIQVVDAAGEVTYASPPLVGAPPLVEGDADPVVRTVDAGATGRLRVIAIGFLEDSRLVFAAPMTEVEDAVGSLTRSFLIGLPLLALGLAVIVWLVVGRTLRPVDDAMRRERQLVADAGHDLRSPLAGVRALLETEPTDRAELEQNRIDALATLSRLEAIAEDLLVLSRTDPDLARPALQRLVDLDEVVLRQVRLVRDADAVLEVTGVSAGQVVGNESDLERMVENLLSNAIRHARSRVSVSVQEVDGMVELAIGDDGPGIPVEDRARVFERFTRLDESRSAVDGGAGLGLAIVQSVSLAHGGSAAVATSPLGGAEIRVVLPASLGSQSSARMP